ncbi:MAG: DNA mismatch repair protein MutS [Acidobacteriota bacterium]
MFRQYRDIKSRYHDAILLFRMGDFYEMFYDDALSAAQTLEITLTKRGKGTRSEAPMCGVPHHSVDGYIAKLTDAGFKVAICEQLEDPSCAKGLVRRDVVRVVTPGTCTESEHSQSGEARSLGALNPGDHGAGVAWVDLSTGDFRLAQFHGEAALARSTDLLSRFNCREILLDEQTEVALSGGLAGVSVTRLEDWRFAPDPAREILQEQFGTAHLAGFGVETLTLGLGAAGALLAYLQETQKTDLKHIDRITHLQEDAHLILDSTTLANLEILRTQRDGTRRGSLLGLIDHTVTRMGGRLLKERLLHPLRDPERIRRRLAAVADLEEHGQLRARIRGLMSPVADLERLLGRLTLGTAGPRDLQGLGASLACTPPLVLVHREVSSRPLRELLESLDPVPEVSDLTSRALVEAPPAGIREGGLIRGGFDPGLDELRKISRSGKEFMTALEERERRRTGIGSLKVGYNRVFGYFIEASKTHAAKIPGDYIRKQTLTSAERYATPELKAMEEKILSAQEQSLALEARLFESLRQQVLEHAGRIRTTASRLAELDVAATLAEVASRSGWCRPQVDDGDTIRITAGRHPVVEAAVGSDRFVPNDVHLNAIDSQIQIITGPNMGGKSTLLRQTGLMVLLAQAGSFVPAKAARIGVADRIFCRVGASDDLAQGQSTFMVEMTETANILHHATPRSLVLLDEIGRGTATFDGLSIAWAVVEQLHEREAVAARTLFATHYHELTELATVLPRVTNHRITAREHDGRIIFLHRLEPGAADQSYGIQVAALAGVPPEVVGRAREILASLEAKAVGRDGRPRLARHAKNRFQMGLFAPRPRAPHLGGRAAALVQEQAEARRGREPRHPERTPAEIEILEQLRSIHPEALRPLDALSLLEQMRRRLAPRVVKDGS